MLSKTLKRPDRFGASVLQPIEAILTENIHNKKKHPNVTNKRRPQTTIYPSSTAEQEGAHS